MAAWDGRFCLDTSSSEFHFTVPEMEKLSITVGPQYFDAHASGVEAWSPGSPAFPEPLDVVDREVAGEVNLASLLPCCLVFGFISAPRPNPQVGNAAQCQER
jgi:hypothetical protein